MVLSGIFSAGASSVIWIRVGQGSTVFSVVAGVRFLHGPIYTERSSQRAV